MAFCCKRNFQEWPPGDDIIAIMIHPCDLTAPVAVQCWSGIVNQLSRCLQYLICWGPGSFHEFSGDLKQQIGSPGETMPERYLSISWQHESRWGFRSAFEIIPPSTRQPTDSLTEVSGLVPRLLSQSSFTFDGLFINTELPTYSLGKKKSAY